jgi:hypothetical protein
MRFRGPVLSILAALALARCASTPVDRYRAQLQPLVGHGDKTQVAAVLGQPALCRPEGAVETCEYRVARPRPISNPVPSAPAILDLQPRDVIHAYFDDKGVLRDWQALVIQP